MTSTMIVAQPPRLARLPAAALISAPLVWLAGWTIMRLGGGNGPNTGWDIAHSLWIAGFVLFAMAAYGLFQLVGGSRVGRVAFAVSLIGAFALVAQMVIDLVAGLSTTDKAGLSDLYDKIFAVPGIELVFFTVGPTLLFVGLLALVVLAAVRRVASRSQVVLVTLGICLMVVGRPASGALRLLEGLGAICLWLALAPLGRDLDARRSR